MNKMGYRFSGAVCLLSLVISIPSFGQGAFQVKTQNPLTVKLDDRTLGASYDVLGLKLGMNAAEVKRIIGERFHVTEGSFTKKGYNVVPGLPHYVPGRPYIQQFSLSSTGQLSYLRCSFTEVVPGEGKGPEMLYEISYTPNSEHDPDIQAFVDQVYTKFGKPNEKGLSGEAWGDPAYSTYQALIAAGLPILELSSTPRALGRGYGLWLQNQVIPYHMEAVFISKKTTAPPI